MIFFMLQLSDVPERGSSADPVFGSAAFALDRHRRLLVRSMRRSSLFWRGASARQRFRLTASVFLPGLVRLWGMPSCIHPTR